MTPDFRVGNIPQREEDAVEFLRFALYTLFRVRHPREEGDDTNEAVKIWEALADQTLPTALGEANQADLGQELIEELASDLDIGELHLAALLDIMACAGLALSRPVGNPASEAYFQEIGAA